MIDVEPLIRDELERRVPLADGARADWDDVLVRAGRPPRTTRRRRALVLAVAVGLVVGASAYALGREFLVGDPAPQSVREQAGLLHEVKGELIPRVHAGPRIRAEETRLAAALDTSTGPVYLWVAPSDRGDCLFKQIVGTELPDGRPNLSGGGCGVSGRPVDSSLSGSRVGDDWLVLVSGHVDSSVSHLEVEHEGRRLAIPLSGRFFLFELHGVGDSEIPDVAVVGYDAAGREVARVPHGRPQLFPPRPVDVSEVEPLLEIETRRTKKPIRLYVTRRDGERCIVLESPGGTGSGCGGRGPRPDEIPIGPNQIGSAPKGMLLLWGEVGSAIATLELRFEDGRVERLPLAQQFTLYQVDPADFAAGRRPIELVGRGAAGDVVARRSLGPWLS